jgi:Xaa-Pro dipeptidase
MEGRINMLNKRDFLKSAALGLAAGAAGSLPARAATQAADASTVDLPGPITVEERAARIAKAQRLMQAAGMGALLLEPGPSMVYFSGLDWWRSERLTAVVIPAEGEIAVVTPYFEEASILERLGADTDVRLWHEDEDPFLRVRQLLDDRGTRGPLGLERSVRFFVADGLRAAMPDRGIVSGAPVVDGCRTIKSEHEIRLMQAANDITMAAYRETYAAIETGMTPAEIRALMNAATERRGGRPTFAIALIGEASAYPHGSDQPQEVTPGEVILMDCGCSVHGYQSDISRTWVHGEASPKQRAVWNTARAGQVLALETAQVGTPAGAIDRAVRAFYEREGYGPDYQLPGLSHRLGHGIGMEGHEPINFVRSEETPLAPGMCLSNEPGIYLPGAFGVRLEDCLYMTEAGPKLFSGLSPSIEEPMG